MKSNISLRACLLLVVFAAAALQVWGQSPAMEPLVYQDIEFPQLPYASRWIEVNGAKMHYMEAGDPAGMPILLLHGNPTWSYLWRDVMPHLEDSGRVIAVDLVGMGMSDKPDIGYSFVEHREYLWRFIELMKLDDLALVVHDWGSALGFDYARNHPDKVRGIAFMEALMAPFPGFDEMPGAGSEMMRMIRSGDGRGEAAVLGQNMFIEQFLPSAVIRELSQEELNAYRAPFPNPESRQPILVWPRQIPVGGEPADVHQIVSAYAQWLPQTAMPMLLLHAEPGAMIPQQALMMLQGQLQNLETVNVGAGIHFIQEDQPEAIGQAIAEWLGRVVSAE